jgi:hypothetical protein
MTRSRIAGLTSGCPESTRDTEDMATPASSATSRMLERPAPPVRSEAFGW